MDKWDESVERIKNGMLAEEPEAALAGALQLFADFGRTLEMISADMDRVAAALEKTDKSPTMPALEMVGVEEFFFTPCRGDEDHVLFVREGEERLIDRDDLDDFWNSFEGPEIGSQSEPAQVHDL